ncbi:MAG: hypothetical protein KJO11_02340 [Gemmatimonadetes bacterium]|nr:hypothetical protein [Gemmatimonadota bacterium]
MHTRSQPRTRRPVPNRPLTTLLSWMIGGGLLLPAGLAGQGISVAAKVGTTGIGADVIVALAPKLALKGGVGFTLIDAQLDFDCDDAGGDCTTYDVEPPPIFLTGSLDIRLAGPVRVMAGLLYRSDDTRFSGDLDGPSEIGDVIFAGPGRIEGALTTPEIAPFLGVGFGGLGGEGFSIYLDLALAYAGDAGVEMSGSGPIASEPGFDAELDKERRRILDEIDSYYRFWPIVNLGFRIPL